MPGSRDDQAPYRQIVADLRDMISRGELREGDRLPSVRELARQYGVARVTVERAHAALEREGLAVSRPRSGMFVRSPSIRLTIERYATISDPDRSQRDLGPWQTTCAGQGLSSRVEVTAVEHEPASKAVADRLGVDVGTAVVRRSRRMWAADQPLQLQSAWMPAELVEGTPLAGRDTVVGGVYAAMTRHGFPPARAVEEVSTRIAVDAERDQLNLTRGAPVLELWRTTYGVTGRATEALQVIAARCAYVYEVPIG